MSKPDKKSKGTDKSAVVESPEKSTDLSACLKVTKPFLIRDTPRSLALDVQRAQNYRSVKELQEKSRSLRFSELYGPNWNCSEMEKLRDFYKRKFIESKINDDNFVRINLRP